MKISSFILLTMTLPALELDAEQPDVFEKPVRLTYGDPEIIAPMMGPAMTVDWDRDGRMDLVGRNHWWPEPPKWWRNTGEKHNGVTLFELGVSPGPSIDHHQEQPPLRGRSPPRWLRRQ